MTPSFVKSMLASITSASIYTDECLSLSFTLAVEADDTLELSPSLRDDTGIAVDGFVSDE